MISFLSIPEAPRPHVPFIPSVIAVTLPDVFLIPEKQPPTRKEHNYYYQRKLFAVLARTPNVLRLNLAQALQRPALCGGMTTSTLPARDTNLSVSPKVNRIVSAVMRHRTLVLMGAVPMAVAYLGLLYVFTAPVLYEVSGIRYAYQISRYLYAYDRTCLSARLLNTSTPTCV